MPALFIENTKYINIHNLHTNDITTENIKAIIDGHDAMIKLVEYQLDHRILIILNNPSKEFWNTTVAKQLIFTSRTFQRDLIVISDEELPKYVKLNAKKYI